MRSCHSDDSSKPFSDLSTAAENCLYLASPLNSSSPLLELSAMSRATDAGLVPIIAHHWCALFGDVNTWSGMFEEDSQWSSGSQDPSEEDLHHKLFGETGGTPCASVGAGDQSKKTKRKREQEKDLSPISKMGRSEGNKKGVGKNTELKVHGEGISLKKVQKSEPLQVNGISEASTSPLQHAVRQRPNKCTKLYSKLSSQLEGSRFRMINQQLYTSTGTEAKLTFAEDPELFDVYHRGFAAQVAKWPENPIDRVITHVRSLPEDIVVCDFGCGEAKLAGSVRQRVHSFDLVAVNERVTACDMAHVPLKRHAVDVCVFCLSLMGINVSDFVREARRVVRKGGELRICEVSSRFSSFEQFGRDVEAFGFKLKSTEEFSKMFVEFVFIAVKKPDAQAKLPQISLKPCVYKRR